MSEDIAKPEAHEFTDIHQTPPAWRQYKGGRFRLHQINAWVKRAHDDDMLLPSSDADGTLVAWIPAYGHAKEEFVQGRAIGPDGYWTEESTAGRGDA